MEVVHSRRLHHPIHFTRGVLTEIKVFLHLHCMVVWRELTLDPVASSPRDILQPSTGVVGWGDSAMLSSLLNKSLSLRKM